MEILYFTGCPSWQVAEVNLRAALASLGRTDEVGHRRVETPEEADAIGFCGSPTVLIDGRDPFAAPGDAVGLACRVYQTPDGPAGAPTAAQLEAALVG